MQLRLGERLWILWGYLPPSILKKSFPSVCSVLPAVKHVFYSMFLVHVVVFVCPCVGIGPEKVGKTFGVYVKRLYLCTRFREARPCVAAAERGR